MNAALAPSPRPSPAKGEGASASSSGAVGRDGAMVLVELASCADPAALERWLDTSKPGSPPAIYASGLELPRSNPVVVMVRGWAAARLATLGCRKHPDRPGFSQWLVYRSFAAPAARATAPGSTRCRAECVEQRAMLALLRRCALAGKSCPSNTALARRLKLRSRFAARDLFNRLVAAGAIRVEERGKLLPRVVTIVATGKATGA